MNSTTYLPAPFSFSFCALLLSLVVGLAGTAASAQPTSLAWALATASPAAGSSQPAAPNRLPGGSTLPTLPAPSISQAGFNNTVTALLALPDGTLFAAGSFTKVGEVSANRIAKWNGSAWVALGEGLSYKAYALATQGTDLYVAGNFVKAGAQPAMAIARWDGQAWHNLSGGLDGSAHSLAVIGKDLYVGGSFQKAGDIPAANIARWDGAAWHALDKGVSTDVKTMAVLGTTLYVGAGARLPNGTWHDGVSRWNGQTWSAVGGKLEYGFINSLALVGNELYVAGYFPDFAGKAVNGIARWDGREWQALEKKLTHYSIRTYEYITYQTMTVVGRDIYAGISTFHDPANESKLDHLAKWDGTQWTCLDAGIQYSPKEPRIPCTVSALALQGNKLYVGGNFFAAGGQPVSNLACWDGTRWVDVTK